MYLLQTESNNIDLEFCRIETTLSICYIICLYQKVQYELLVTRKCYINYWMVLSVVSVSELLHNMMEITVHEHSKKGCRPGE